MPALSLCIADCSLFLAMNVLDQIRPQLLRVKSPAQYMGGEVNAIAKDWREDRARFALCFPDAYTIGMSNQGFKILYHLLNEKHDDILCERAFAPWFDMEAVLREQKIPLYSLENYRSLADFDVLGFSLQNETSYTNLLNMLDLAGIPVRAADRGAGFQPAGTERLSDAGDAPASLRGQDAHATLLAIACRLASRLPLRFGNGTS